MDESSDDTYVVKGFSDDPDSEPDEEVVEDKVMDQNFEDELLELEVDLEKEKTRKQRGIVKVRKPQEVRVVSSTQVDPGYFREYIVLSTTAREFAKDCMRVYEHWREWEKERAREKSMI